MIVVKAASSVEIIKSVKTRLWNTHHVVHLGLCVEPLISIPQHSHMSGRKRT